MRKKFLFVTANDNEKAALLEDKNFFKFKPQRSTKSSDAAFYNVGKFGLYDVVHLGLLNQGSIKVDAANLAVSEAIEAWNPDAVILIGIAFGKDNGIGPEPRQHIGDVLVSSQVADYDSGKIIGGKMLFRGTIADSGRQLFSVFNHYAASWQYKIDDIQSKVICGMILSGDKVVDDKNFKKQLFEHFDTAIGGEMEGRGVHAACRRKGLEEWIVVKAISDWGVNKNIEKEKNQKIAAKSVVSFLKFIFNIQEAFDKLPSREESRARTLKDNPCDKTYDSGLRGIKVHDVQCKNLIVGETINVGEMK